MSSPSTNETYISFNTGLAIIIAATTVLIPQFIFWQYGSAIFGGSAIRNLAIIGAAGGAISLTIYADAGSRILAVVPGLIAGAGASAFTAEYASFFSRDHLFKYELVMTFCLGGGPGIGLFFLLCSLRNRWRRSTPEIPNLGSMTQTRIKENAQSSSEHPLKGNPEK